MHLYIGEVLGNNFASDINNRENYCTLGTLCYFFSPEN